MPPRKIYHLRCENLVSPLGITSPWPKISWRYENFDGTGGFWCIKAATAKELLDEPDLWNTGKVLLDMPHIIYGGKKLESRQKVWFMISFYPEDKDVVICSEPSFFEMGITTEDEWSPSSWITSRPRDEWVSITSTQYEPSPVFIKDFHIEGIPDMARLYICALGLYKVEINQTGINDYELEPAFTHYNKKSFCQTFDVSKLLKSGDNNISIMLGNGWYNCHTIDNKRFHDGPWRDSPGLRCRLEITTGEPKQNKVIVSDGTWKHVPGPIIMDSIRNGEFYDARKEIIHIIDTDFKNVKSGRIPTDNWKNTEMPPMGVTEKIEPVLIKEVSKDCFVYDFGRHISGFAELTVNGQSGTKIELMYRERSDTYDPNYKHAGQAPTDNDIYVLSGKFQTDSYILCGNGEEKWKPSFTYHGFRFIYVKINGKLNRPPELKALVVHTDLKKTGDFTCSDETINKLQLLSLRSFLYNYHGFPTDCPAREKAGWTGDAYLSAYQAFFNFDMQNAYIKWCEDICETQIETGRIASIVPTAGWGYQENIGICWLNVFFELPYLMRVFCADNRFIEKYYDPLKKLYKYYEECHRTGKLKNMLGDWLKPFSEARASFDKEIYNMAALYRASVLLLKFAKILGDGEKERELGEKCCEIKDLFNLKFFNGEEGVYGKGSQSELSIALAFDLVPEKHIKPVVEKLLKEIDNCKGHLDTGIQGTRFLLDALAKYDYVDRAIQIIKIPGYPGFDWWLENGATTLWERWNGTGSLNHSCYCYLSGFFYSAIAGIVPLDGDGEYGFKRFHLKPAVTCDLKNVKCSCDTPFGKVNISWEKKNSVCDITGSIPHGSSAILVLPGGESTQVMQGDKKIGIHGKDKNFKNESVDLYLLEPGEFIGKLKC